jgi:hypothetical protein
VERAYSSRTRGTAEEEPPSVQNLYVRIRRYKGSATIGAELSQYFPLLGQVYEYRTHQSGQQTVVIVKKLSIDMQTSYRLPDV